MYIINLIFSNPDRTIQNKDGHIFVIFSNCDGFQCVQFYIKIHSLYSKTKFTSIEKKDAKANVIRFHVYCFGLSSRYAGR